MSLKVVVLLTLVAAAAANPTPTAPLLDGVVGEVLHIGGTTLGDTLGSLLGNIFGAKNVPRKELPNILKIKVKGFSDVITLGVKVVLSLGDVVDASITGLGHYITRIVACILKIVVCFLGSPGNNAICSNDWNTQFGVSASAAVDIQALIRLYGLSDCRSKVQSIISIYTRGRDVSGITGSLKIVLQIALELSERLDIVISGRGSLDKSDLTSCYRKIGTLMGAIGNSHKHGLGVKIVNNFFSTCNKHIKHAGYPDIGKYDNIVQQINLGNNDNAPWAITDVSVDANSGASLGLGQIIGNVLKGVIGIGRLAVNLVSQIVKIVLHTLDDCITLVVKIVLGLGGLLDSTVSGLGSLLVRVVAVLIKIVLCFLGGNGSKYGACRSGWNSQFGVSGEADSIEALIELYGVGNCRSDVDQYISRYTKGKGISSTSGSVKVLLQSSITLSQCIQDKKWDKNLLVTVFRHVTYLLGVIGNSNVKGAGTQVCNKFIPACNKFLTAEDYPGFGDDQNSIIAVIEAGNSDNYVWSADINPSANAYVGFSIGLGGKGSGGSKGGSNGGSNGDSNGDSNGGSNGGVIGSLLGGIMGALRGVTSLASNILTDIVNIRINALVDVLNLIYKLCLGIGGVINSTIEGLGLLLSRIVAAIFKIGICVRGFPGDQSICNAGWNKQFGISGDATNDHDLLVLFKVLNAEAEVENYINSYTKGKGIESVSGSVRIIFDHCRTMSGYITNYQTISKETITNTFVSLTTISVAIANANKKDSGVQITQKVIPTCGKYFVDKGYPDVTQSTTSIIAIAGKANGDTITWSKDNNGKNNSGNTESNSGSTGGNSGNTGGSTGGNSGNTGGSTGNNSGSTDNNSGNTGGSTGNNSGNTGGSTGNNSDSTDNNSGNTGGSTGNNSGNTGGSTGNNSDSTDNNSGNTGGSTGNNSDSTDNNSGNTGGSTGSNSGSTGGNSGNTGGSTGNTGGSTDNNSGSTGNTPGNTGEDSGETGGNSGNNGGSTGGNTTGGSKGGSEGGSTGGSTDIGDVSGNGQTTAVAKGNGLVTNVKDLFQNDKTDEDDRHPSVTAVLNLEIPQSYEDVLSFCVTVIKSLGSVINLFISGLGSLLGRIVGSVLRYVVCVLGGSQNADNYVCKKAYCEDFGVNITVNTWAGIAAGFNVDNAEADLTVILNSFTNNKGLDSLKGSEKTCFSQAQALAKMCAKGTKLCKKDMTDLISIITTLLGSFANSWSSGLGKQICDDLIPVCNTYLQKNGYEAISSSQIYATIKLSNGVDAVWNRKSTTTTVNN